MTLSVSAILPLLMLSIPNTPELTTGPADTIPVNNGIGKVYLIRGSKIKGYILGVNDSSVSIIEKKYRNNGLFSQQRSIPASQIRIITKKSRLGISPVEGFGIGGLSGIVLGFAIGFTDCDDPDNDCGFFQSIFSSKNLRGAITLSVILGGIGSLVGLFAGGKKKKKIYINGNRDVFIINKNDILYY